MLQIHVSYAKCTIGSEHSSSEFLFMMYFSEHIVGSAYG